MTTLGPDVPGYAHEWRTRQPNMTSGPFLSVAIAAAIEELDHFLDPGGPADIIRGPTALPFAF
jgi:hypothetical protein